MLLTATLGLLPFLLSPLPQDPAAESDVQVPEGVLQDDGEYITLDLSELDEGGLTLRQFIKICQLNTGINFTIDESTTGGATRQQLSTKKLLLYGRKRIRRDEFYSFFQIMMKIHGFVCVTQGSGDLAVVVITQNMASNQTLIKANAQFVEAEDVGDFADKPGTFIYTVVKLKYAEAQDLGTNLRTAIGANTGDNSAFMPLNQEQALLIQGYGPFVAASIRMINVLDVKPDEVQPIFRKIPLREASAEELADILSDLVENLISNDSTRNRNTRNNQPQQAQIETSISAYAQDNSLLVVSDPEMMDKILDLVAQLDTKVEEPHSNYHVYALQYLSAVDLEDAITAFLQDSEQELERVQRQAGGNNNRTSVAQQKIVVQIHEETNSLLVTATRSKWDELKALLDRLDRRQPQVLIETALIEVSSDFSKDIGIEYAKVETPVGEAQKGFVFTSVGITSADNIGDARLPSPTAAGLTFGIFDGEDLGIPFIVNAALSRSDANVLSVPSVLVANNKGAVVRSIDSVPIQNSNAIQGAGVSNSFEYKDAGIILNISPSISAERYLRLDVNLEVSSFRESGDPALPPSTITRSITTAVNLPDGATMWLGGIVRDDTTNTESGIPYLSDIPLIGGLFGSTGKTNLKTTLFFFCTPRILDDFEELADVSDAGKARAAETIGLDRVRMIDPDYQFETPVDLILEDPGGDEEQVQLGSLNLSGFAAPTYGTKGGAEIDRDRVGGAEMMVPQGGR